MLGFSELFTISGYIEPAWFDFLQSDEIDEDEVHSLEEFTFGMSHEENSRASRGDGTVR